MTTNGVDHLKQRTVLFNPEKEDSQCEEQFKEIKMNQKQLKEKVSKYQRK
jgi:hypothetical protein